MADATKASSKGILSQVLPPSERIMEGLTGVASINESAENRIDAIEMAGEESASGLHRLGSPTVSADARFLHASRTVNQLVTDRNRAVGIYLAVASLLWTGSSAILNARPGGDLIVPIEAVQRVCLPATFGTLAILAVFIGLLLIRARIGLIYEVAKMNILLGLPVGRVRRVNPLSIFFIMHVLISTAGGATAGVFTYYLFVYADFHDHEVLWAWACGIAVGGMMVVAYIATVLYTTSDQRLQGA